MELSQLSYFRALARVGNMTRAAEQLHITQPALSRAIAALESDLGRPLFTRDKGKLSLNQAGELFLETADKIFIELESGLSRVNAYSPDFRDSIRYGVTHYGMISGGIQSFLLRAQGIHVFEELMPPSLGKHEVRDSLESCAVDFAISAYPLRSPVLDTDKLYTDSFVLLAHKDNPISEKKEALEQEIHKMPLLLIGNHHQYDALYARPNFSNNIVFDGEDTFFVLSLVQANSACVVMLQGYYAWLRETGLFSSDQLVSVPVVKNNRALSIDIYLSRVKNRYLPDGAEHLIDFLFKFYSETGI